MTPQTLSPETMLILIGVAVAGLAILILLLTRKLGLFLLVAGGIVAVILVARAMLGQAQATRETAKAAKSAATAATVASAGQTVSSLALAALAGVLAVVAIAALGGAAYFWLRARRAEKRAATSQWTSGPNALWGRTERPNESPPPVQIGAAASESSYLLPMLIQQMMSMQAMMVRQLFMGPARPADPPWRQSALGWDELTTPARTRDKDSRTGHDEAPIPLDWDW